MARCINCGMEIGDVKVCPNCGAVVAEGMPRGNSHIGMKSQQTVNEFTESSREKDYSVLTVVALILCWPAGLIIMWKLANWPKKTKYIITAVAFALMLSYAFVACNS